MNFIETFRKLLPNDLYTEANNSGAWDLNIYGCTGMRETELLFRNNFNVGMDEVMLYTRDTSFWSNRNQGMVLTDLGVRVIPDNDNPSNMIAFAWTDVEQVDYKNQIMVFWPYGQHSNYDDACQIHISYFIKDSDNYNKFGQRLARFFTELAKCACEEAKKTYSIDDALQELNEQRDKTEGFDINAVNAIVEKALPLAQTDGQLVSIYYSQGLSYRNWAQILYDKYNTTENWDEKKNIQEQINNAYLELQRIMNVALSSMQAEETIQYWRSECIYWWCFATRQIGDKVQAVRWAIEALPGANDDRERNNLKSIISGSVYSEFFGKNIIVPGRGYGVWGITWEDLRKDVVRDIEDVGCHDLARVVSMSSYDETQNNIKDYLEKNPALKEDEKEILGLVLWDMEDKKKNSFSSVPYTDRQFVFLTRDLDSIGGCYDASDNIKFVFPLNEIPQDVTFPFGHPQPNTLYYAHPLRPFYMPYEKASLMLFYEKVQEVCRLFQCLGATQIITRTLKGHKVSESFSANQNVDGKAGIGIYDVEGGCGNSQTENVMQESRNEMSLTQSFDPTQFPYCPDDLLWTTQDPDLQTLIKQRMSGGMLTFSKRVSSFETMSVSSSRVVDVKAAFDSFMSKVSVNYNSNVDRTFSETEETEWEISVVFKPMNEFANTYKSISNLDEDKQMSAKEEEYLQELRYVLEDGEIGPRERNSLERLRVKLCISEERATELEFSVLNPSLTAEEREYLDEYRAIRAEGELRDRDVRTLERLAQRNGITPLRAKELERMV